MKFVAILNKNSGSGLAVNALAQMSLGLGHRVEGYPDVDIYFGTTAEVRAFRTLVADIAPKTPDTAVYSDFPNTMEGGDTSKLLDLVVGTPEEAVVYHASAIIAEELDPRLVALTKRCEQLAGYVPYTSDKPATLWPVADLSEVEHTTLDLKTTTVINRLPLAQTINQVVLANLEVGDKTPLEKLHLLTMGRLTAISYNTHPIVKPESSAKHKSMAQAAKGTKELYTSTHWKNDNEPLVSVIFGERAVVESIVARKFTRAFDASLAKEGLVRGALVSDAETAPIYGGGGGGGGGSGGSSDETRPLSPETDRHRLFKAASEVPEAAAAPAAEDTSVVDACPS